MFLSLSLHPLVPATIAFLTGICLQQGVVHALWLTPSALCLMAYITRLKYRPSHVPRITWISSALLLAIAGAVGFCSMWYQEKEFHHISHLCSQSRHIQGVAVDISSGASENSTVLVVETTELVDQQHNKTAVKARVVIRSAHQLMVEVGDRVEIGPLKLQPPRGTFAAYAMKEGCAATGTITKKTIVRVVEPDSYISSIRAKIRNHLAAASKQKMSPQSYALFATIFLGQKQQHQHRVQHAFAHWGLSHQLARSGLHLVIFILILRWLLGYLPFAYRLKQTLLLLCVLCYFLLSWPTVSFMRAIVTFVLYYAYDTARVQINPIHLLTIAVWLILLPCPIQLFFLDFQLSFGLSYALLLIAMAHHQRKIGVGPAHISQAQHQA